MSKAALFLIVFCIGFLMTLVGRFLSICWRSFWYKETDLFGVCPPFSPLATHQESPREHEARKRVSKSFKQQQSAINAMALKPHACGDPFSCTKKICFKATPDKIVSTEIVKRKNDSERAQEAK